MSGISNFTCPEVVKVEYPFGEKIRMVKINTLYCGYAGYVKLDRASLKNMQTLVISQFDNVPVLIHQIVKKY